MKNEIYNHLVYKQPNTLPSKIESLVQQDEACVCLLALSYLVHQKNAQKAHSLLASNQERGDTQYCLESNMLIQSIRGENDAAIYLATELLKKFPDAFFAHYILGYNSIKEPANALKHYLAILESYPEHNGVKLHVAEMLALLKQYKQAHQYIRKCSPSLEQKMYLFLLPITKTSYRIALLGISILVAIVFRANVSIWIGLTLAIVMAVIVSLKKTDRTLVASRLIFAEIVITASWLLVYIFGR